MRPDKGIAAITLFVSDLAVAKSFYARAFALPVHFEDAESCVFAFGGTLVNLLVRSAAAELVDPKPVAPTAETAAFVLTLAVDDVDAACAELADRGVSLLNGPVDRPWEVRTASFEDPDGHVWELAH
jgi:lactoylglutathione lyase